MYVSAHYQPDLRFVSSSMVRPGIPEHRRWTHENLCEPVWRLYWFPRKQAKLKLGDLELEPGPEDLILIPPNTPFGTVCEEPLEQFVAHFLAAPPFDSLAPSLIRIPAEPCVPLMARITELVESRDSFDLEITLLNMELALHALNAIPSELRRFRPEDPKIGALLRRIRLRPGDRYELKSLAKELGMSVNTLLRRFKAHAGSTPQKYIARARVEAACLMLWHEEQSVDEIASSLGFCNRNHFTQTFIGVMGQGPASYRRSRAAASS